MTKTSHDQAEHRLYLTEPGLDLAEAALVAGLDLGQPGVELREAGINSRLELCEAGIEVVTRDEGGL